MVYLAPVFLILIAYVLGELITSVLRDLSSSIAEKCLIGTFVLLLSWEGIVLPSIKLLLPFSFVCKIFSLFLILILLVTGTILGKRIYKNLYVKEPLVLYPISLIVAILIVQIFVICIVKPDITYDFSVETVNTTLNTDLIYEHNPLTGGVYEYGMSLSGKVVTLPLLYAYLTRLFGCSASYLVYRGMSIWSLFLSFMGFSLWPLILFVKNEKRALKTAIFLVGVGLLNLSSLFSSECIFSNVIYKGFAGETLVFAVVEPYIIITYYKGFSERKWQCYCYIVLALLSTIMMTSYERGLIPCIISLILCILISVVSHVRRWINVKIH